MTSSTDARPRRRVRSRRSVTSRSVRAAKSAWPASAACARYRPSTQLRTAWPRPVPAAITAMLPLETGRPACSTRTSESRSTGSEYAIASRSFNRLTRGNPNVFATRFASTRHGTFVRSATSPATGPATPKHAEPIDDAPLASLSRKLEIITARSGKSSVRSARIVSARGRVDDTSNRPSRVVVPPTSPASTFVIDNRFILLHLDAVSPV